jgi:cytoskeletal protein CcmA (bactofilin family)
MFSQSADQAAADQSSAPIGMRELPPQPAKPVMPAYATATAAPEPVAEQAGPGADDSVIARDDHLEGTFTSRGTVVVMGSVKGRIEAVQLRIEDGASVDADVIVDEAIIAGEFTGNLTCRGRLEARASGRINGRVETFKLMLHEGASVEGEMHMLTEAPKDASATIRGSAPLRGETGEGGGAASERTTQALPASTTPVTPATSASMSAVAQPVPTVTPSSGVKRNTEAAGTATSGSAPTAAVPSGPPAGAEASSVRSSVVDTLRAENARIVAPRTTTGTRGYGYSGSPVSSGSGTRNGTSSTGF